VFYLKDDTVFTIVDVPYDVKLPHEFTHYSYNERKHRIMASQMEQRHATRIHGLIDPLTNELQAEVSRIVRQHLAPLPVMIFCNSSTVARAVEQSVRSEWLMSSALVTGTTPKQAKLDALDMFRNGSLDILIGTATLATGTDGLDKVCNTLLIIDDTDDDALRRQLVGRIMPRGAATSTAGKKIVRLVPRIS
jgi:superfamily II DNA or RNA helicase